MAVLEKNHNKLQPEREKVCVCVCVCVRERERERRNDYDKENSMPFLKNSDNLLMKT